MIRLEFEMKLLADYHVGAGYGDGPLVDSALLRDADGVPVIRGTVMTGILRDALYRLLQLPPMQKHYQPCNLLSTDGHYCGQESQQIEGQQIELCPICRLFGSPRSPKSWIISSARPKDRMQIGGNRRQDDDATIAYRARIHPQTRRAKARQLFAEEEGNRNLTFRFNAMTHHVGADTLDEAALLVAAARYLREFGRSRRRGRGECLITLLPDSKIDISLEENVSLQDVLLKRFKTQWLDQQNKSSEKQESIVDFAILEESIGEDQRPVRLQLLIRLDQPVLLAERAEVGNQFSTQPIITGTSLLGAFAQIAASRFDLNDTGSDAYQAFHDVFLREAIQFPSLLPTLRPSGASLTPFIPAPSNWLTCKTYPAFSQARIKHSLVLFESDDQEENCPICDDTLESLSDFVEMQKWDGFTVKGQFKPKRATELHISVDPEKGRVNQGALFGYDALKAGQFFVGDLICQNKAAWHKLQALTQINAGKSFTLRIGKATRRGYGKVTAILTSLDGKADTHIGTTKSIDERLGEKNTDEPQILFVLLLTDIIVTDRWGRFQQGFIQEWLAQELKLDKSAFKIVYSSAATRPVDGFNGHLGLPRWRDIALKAGSAAVLELVNPPGDWAQTLRTVEQEGIGLRRAEGFGRIAFNHPVYTRFQTDAVSINIPEDLKLASGGQIDKQHQNWEKELDRLRLPNLDKERVRDSFDALARWLYTGREWSLTNIKQELGRLGTPTQDLKAVISIDEYGARDESSKENFFDGDGKVGREVISKLIEKLDETEREGQRKYAAEFFPTAIIMLAEQIAALVDAERRK